MGAETRSGRGSQGALKKACPNEAVFFFGRGNRFLFVVRIALLVVVLVALFVFHAHGRTLEVLQGVRLVLLIALIASAWVIRRRRI